MKQLKAIHCLALIFYCMMIVISNSQSELISDESNEAKGKTLKNVVNDVRIHCNSNDITISLSTIGDSFDGLIYPKGLSKNSSCMSEYKQVAGNRINYTLPLRSCNTMNIEVVNGIEYFNTIIVQPHRKLVTNQGKGYHVRCRYQTEEKSSQSDLNDGSYGLTATAAMPGATMRIYMGEPVDGRVAESVKIGDPLTLVVGIDSQDIYGMHITDCLVRDGLGWSQQLLINSEGCPLDNEIVGPFEYSQSKTTALVHFQAHKFPHTPSVYYQCNIRLCIRHAGGCDDVPPVCDGPTVINLLTNRYKRQTVELDETRGVLYDTDREDLKVKVYSGLYVSEASDLEEDFGRAENDLPSKVLDPTTICFPQRDFAIGIAIAGLILVICVIVIILVLLTRRRRRKDLSTTGSSIYSGPFTATGFSSRSS